MTLKEKQNQDERQRSVPERIVYDWYLEATAEIGRLQLQVQHWQRRARQIEKTTETLLPRILKAEAEMQKYRRQLGAESLDVRCLLADIESLRMQNARLTGQGEHG